MKRSCLIPFWIVLAAVMAFAPPVAASLLSSRTRHIAGNADFKRGDSRDILPKNKAPGEVFVRHVNGALYSKAAFPGVLSSLRFVMDSSASDRDGSVEILLMNRANGNVMVRRMVGPAPLHLDVIVARAPASIPVARYYSSSGVFSNSARRHFAIQFVTCQPPPGKRPRSIRSHDLSIRSPPSPLPH